MAVAPSLLVKTLCMAMGNACLRMRPQNKIIIGALLIFGGVYWYSLEMLWGTGLTNLESLAIMVKGGIGVVIFLIGLVVVWIESDELKMQRQMDEQDFEPDTFKEQGQEFAGETSSEIEIEDVDYDTVVEGTVDEVKDEVEQRDLDPKDVLEAEIENKDRKTLKEWLESRIGSDGDE